MAKKATDPKGSKTLAEGSFDAVTLRSPARALALTATGKTKVNLAQEAMKWTYVVRNRQRWTAGTAAKEQERLAIELLTGMGVSEKDLLDLARAGIVDVSTRWAGQEEEGWPARVLPWEYVITAATRDLRGDKPLTVVRHLDRGDREGMPQGSPQSVLFVASEPGLLRGHFSFDNERELFRSQLVGSEVAWHQLDSPSLAELQEAIGKCKPDIVHLAGFDSHEALDVLRRAARMKAARSGKRPADFNFGIDEKRDGYILAGRPGIETVRPEALGRALTVNGHRPLLVSLNIRNSAARIAPQIVAAGVWSAIGFQDMFDDQLAEVFFSVFYGDLRRSAWNPKDAFRSAWETIRRQPLRMTQGSGVALWSAAPLVAPPRPQHAFALAEPAELRPLHPDDVPPSEFRNWLRVEAVVTPELNYSLLHNKRSLFCRFQIFYSGQDTRVLRGIRVKVDLAVGGERATFDRMLDLSSSRALDDISVPLTSSLLRSVHESVQTSVFAEVTWGDHVVLRETYSVRLVPVDQWRDSDADRRWLPSFVFPRDVAVTRLIDTAQRYVRVLRDDPVSGFDGYQSIDPKDPDPTAEVDLQVQAIWSAIVHELRLTYINPPPGYSSELDSQRLRTPSMVARDHAGTCVDLALFFAACLELVDIYPVIFLLEGHAFPGYWRSDEAHQKFTEARPSQIQSIVQADSDTTAVSGAQSEGWFLGKATYDEIIQQINDGNLVPLETVRLTENAGFWEAVEAGRKNFRPKRDFAAMIDIVVARERLVTPLPILGEQT